MTKGKVSDPQHPIWLLLILVPPPFIWYIVFRFVARKNLQRELEAVEHWHTEKVREPDTETAKVADNEATNTRTASPPRTLHRRQSIIARHQVTETKP